MTRTVTIPNIPLGSGHPLGIQTVNLIELTQRDMQTISNLIEGIREAIPHPPGVEGVNFLTPAGALRWLLQQVALADGQP